MDTFTNSEYSRCQKLTEVVLSQPPEADANTNTGEDNGANLVPEVIEGQDEKPPDPQPIQTSYRAISTIRFAVLLGYIIAGNCLCSGILCLTLWGFSKVEDLVPWQKRGFNAISLLLSGVLGFGIGFLLDQIGLLARGSILQRKSHSVKEVRLFSLAWRVGIYCTDWYIMSLDWVYYDGHTIVVRLTLYSPDPHS